MQGFHPPSWTALAFGARPPPPEQEFEMDALLGGWVERQFRERIVLLVLTDGERALLRSQSGVGAGVALSSVPCNPLVRIEPQLFRVLLLRRLRLPLPSAFLPLWPSARLAMPSRVTQQGCVERQVRASRRIFGSRRQVLESLRSWPTGCHCLAGPSWPLTQRWCQLCIVTGVPPQVPHRDGVALEVARRSLGVDLPGAGGPVEPMSSSGRGQ